LLLALLIASLAEPPAAQPPSPVLSRLEVPQQPVSRPRQTSRERLRRYLTRTVARSPRHLDHGVLGVALGVGTPHVYRLELALGLLDHFTLGATLHWLPGQRVPNWSPRAAVAFYRGHLLEIGAYYTQVLYPASRDDGNSTTIEFQRRAHYLMTSVSLSQAWFSGGLDLGLARGRDAIEFFTKDDIDNDRVYLVRNKLGGGLHLRFGTRRIGLIAQVFYPYTSAELVLDLRFGLFELRKRDGWWDL
jgi:hypothetical protein